MAIRKRKTAFFALTFIVLSIVGVVAYKLIGSSVDADGFLHEPFALIPLSYLSFFIGTVLSFITLIGQFSKK